MTSQSDASLLCLPFKLALQDKVHIPICNVALSQRSNDFGPALAVRAINDACPHLHPSMAVDTAQPQQTRLFHQKWMGRHGCRQEGAAPGASPRTGNS